MNCDLSRNPMANRTERREQVTAAPETCSPIPGSRCRRTRGQAAPHLCAQSGAGRTHALAGRGGQGVGTDAAEGLRVRRQANGFSVERLMNLLTALDQDVEIVIRRNPARGKLPGSASLQHTTCKATLKPKATPRQRKSFTSARRRALARLGKGLDFSRRLQSLGTRFTIEER